MKHLTFVFFLLFAVLGFSEGLAQQLVTLSGKLLC